MKILALYLKNKMKEEIDEQKSDSLKMSRSSSKDLELFLEEEQRAQEEILRFDAMKLEDLEGLIKNNSGSKAFLFKFWLR